MNRLFPLIALAGLSGLACSEVAINPNPTPVCGNNAIEGTEACDDGNLVDTDACTAECQVAVCGDGIVQRAVEPCDDGNDSDADACLTDCVVARCGDGVLQVGVETCDEGPDNGSQGGRCFLDCTEATVVLTRIDSPLDPVTSSVTGPTQVLPTDVDGDGRAELFVAVESLRYPDYAGVVRMANDGNGGLWSPREWTGEGAYISSRVPLADIDDDGHDDVVLPARLGDHVDQLVYVMGGPNGFEAEALISTVAGSTPAAFGYVGPIDVLTTDLDGNGTPDVITANQGDGVEISVLLGDGQGGFTPVTPLNTDPASGTGTTRLGSLAMADVTGDGLDDLVMNDRSGRRVVVFPRRGATTFDDALTLDLAEIGGVVAPFDYDHDGTPELAVRLGSSTFGFVDWTRGGLALVDDMRLSFCADGGYQVPPGVGDVDGDGHDDVLIACGTEVGLLSHNAATPRAPRFEVLECPDCGRTRNSSRVEGLALADADGDGALDALSLNIDGDLAIFWNDGAGLSDPPARHFLDLYRTYGYFVGVGAGDVTGDGLPDLVGTRHSGVWMVPGVGNREFMIGGGVSEFSTRSLGLVDLDGEGSSEVVGLSSWYRDDFPVRSLSSLWTWHHPEVGFSTFTPDLELEVDRGDGTLIGHDVKGFASGRVDEDLFDDIVWVSDADDAFVFRFGSADGDLATSAVLDTVSPGVDRAYLADADGDGVLDLFGIDPDAAVVEVRANQGVGTFGLPEFVSTGVAGSDPVDLVVEDLDDDGLAELIVVNRGAGSVWIARGTAPFAWGPPVTLEVGTHPEAAALGDVNDDGVLDLAVASEEGVTLFLGFGNGAFAAGQTLPVGDLPMDVAFADLDGDGVEDLLTANYGSDDVTVLGTR